MVLYCPIWNHLTAFGWTCLFHDNITLFASFMVSDVAQFLRILHNSRAQLTEGNFYNCKMIGTIYYFWYGSNDIGTCPGVVSSSYLRDGSTFGWELAILPWSWPVSVCPQLIIKLSQLPKKPDVRLDLSGLPHERKCLRGRHLFLFHQICHHDGSGPEIYWKKSHNSPI